MGLVVDTSPDPALAVAPPRPLLSHRLSSRKEEILDGLEKIMLSDGFRGLRLTDVAKRLNTSYATLYQLAPTKDELVIMVIDRWYQRSIADALPLLSAADGPVDRLNVWAGFGTAGVSRTSREFWQDVTTHAAITALVGSYTHYYVQVLEAILVEGIDKGTFRPINARMLAVIWEAAVVKLGDPEMWDRADRSLRQISQDWVDLVLHGLLV